ncbi:hypothetical protein [Pseudonocardia sp.]|uniref:hypothetical protein n=1 Tax=Pseudonocardia sp. TaxID=60912 RepID=UPI002633CF22|nr:hypothetical protein [Pseudonocardia sp.]
MTLLTSRGVLRARVCDLCACLVVLDGTEQHRRSHVDAISRIDRERSSAAIPREDLTS